MYAVDGDHESGGAKADILLTGHLPDGLKTGRQDGVQFLPNATQIPAIILSVLYPFEVADGNATRIC